MYLCHKSFKMTKSGSLLSTFKKWFFPGNSELRGGTDSEPEDAAIFLRQDRYFPTWPKTKLPHFAFDKRLISLPYTMPYGWVRLVDTGLFVPGKLTAVAAEGRWACHQGDAAQQTAEPGSMPSRGVTSGTHHYRYTVDGRQCHIPRPPSWTWVLFSSTKTSISSGKPLREGHEKLIF